MKRALSFFVTLCFIVCTQSASAKIWRVNNNSGVTADFTTLQSAHDGASAGDTLHLEASPYSYGALTCNKKLTILGTGYFLDENPNSQAIAQPSKVGTITLNPGAAGTVIMGLDFAASDVNVYAHDIVIRRNKFSNSNGTIHDHTTGTINVYYINNNTSFPANNLVVSQNYGVQVVVHYASTGLLITNNYIGHHGYTGDATTGAALTIQANAVALVQNNIFRRGKVSANNSSFTNNIMYAGTFSGTGNLVSNNIASGEQFGTLNGNMANIAMSTVFVGTGTGISSDGQWKLKVGSPAIGAGYGSTAQNPIDAGMFSGHTPYVLAGMPSMPAIYFFENQPVGSNTDPIDVTIKVKSAGN
jgi:hypothetical protein